MKRLLVQGIFLAVGLSAFILAVLSFAQIYAPTEGGRCGESIATAKWPMWIGCALASNENLAGGLIAGAGAMFAAWVVWAAIDRQIGKTRGNSALTADETFEVVKSDTRDIVEHLNELWRTIDFALCAGHEADFSKRVAIVAITASTWPAAFSIKYLEETSQGLALARRRAFVPLIPQLSYLSDRIGELANLKICDELTRDRIRLMRISLSRLHRQLMAFDEDLANIFSERQLENVNHQKMAAHIRSFVNAHVSN